MFCHKRLKWLRSIRLARLLASEVFDTPIQLEIFEVSLDVEAGLRPLYEALSYVWGSPTGTIPLVCDREALLVTPNCDSLLRHLRLTNNDRILWIDAVCIDQGTTENALSERNAQVAMMGEIYAKASSTICWLGEEISYTREVMRQLDGIGRCPSKRGLRKLMEFEERLRDRGIIEEEASCLDHIFCHPWHSRIWTVQEAVFSEQCWILCGYSSIQWEIYYEAAYFLIFQQPIDDLDVEAARSMVAIDVRQILRNYILGRARASGEDEDPMLSEEDRKSMSLIWCLTNLNQLRATDAKDKVFGLYALYSSLGVPLSKVDYKKSIAFVYADVTIAMISWSKSLQVLSDACSLAREPSLPSWVPDWNDTTARMVQPYETLRIDSLAPDMDIHALARNHLKLSVQGSRIGTVVGIASGGFMLPFPTRLESNDPAILAGSRYTGVPDIDFLRLIVQKVMCLREVLRILEAREELLHGYDIKGSLHEMVTLGRFTFQERFEVWFDILRFPKGTYDQSDGHDLALKWKAEDDGNSEWDAELLECCTVIASVLVNGNSLGEHTDVSQDDLLEFMREMSENLGDRTMMCVHLESNGLRHIGTTFCTVRAEDAVVILDGAQWPVILRPIDGDGQEWRFIGPLNLVGFESKEEVVQGTLVRHFCLV